MDFQISGTTGGWYNHFMSIPTREATSVQAGLTPLQLCDPFSTRMEEEN